MTQPDHPKPIIDNSFSAFIAGLTVGIAGALLLGTEEGKKISQKIIKLSKDRLGMYFNKNIVESLGLKSGEEIQISVPDKKHIMLTIS